MTSFDCTDIKATLSGLIDDQLDADTRHLAERHLSQCAACRALVSEAEALDELIAIDAAAFAPKRLPDGFIDSVLDRTVFARAYEQAGWNWMTWTGWVAAAACMLLAAGIWFLDHNPIAPVDRFVAGGTPSPNDRTRIDQSANDASSLVSWTYEDGFEPGAFPAASETIDPATQMAIDDQLEQTFPTHVPLSAFVQRAAVSADDSDTLHAAAILLDMLADSDLSDFGDIERVREIAVYDELPQRLADVRARLRPAERAPVMAAESILLRIVNGPIDMNDARLMRESVASLNLAAQIGGIGAGSDVATSM